MNFVSSAVHRASIGYVFSRES